jgi:hypothetical protein
VTLSLGVHASQQGGGGITSVTTPGVATQTTGSGFVVDVGWYAAVSTPTVTDNKGNTYSQVGTTTVDAGAPDLHQARFECVNGAGGAGHTVTATWGGTVDGTLFFMEIKTTNGAGLVRDQAPAGNNPTASPYTTNSATTTTAVEVAVACAIPVAFPGTDLVNWGDSFTAVETIGDTNNVTGHTAYRLLSSTGTYSASYTADGSGGATTFSAVMRLTTYSEAAGGGGGTTYDRGNDDTASVTDQLALRVEFGRVLSDTIDPTDTTVIDKDYTFSEDSVSVTDVALESLEIFRDAPGGRITRLFID